MEGLKGKKAKKSLTRFPKAFREDSFGVCLFRELRTYRLHPSTETEDQLSHLLWPVLFTIGRFHHILPKKLPCIAFVPKDDQAKAVLSKVTKPFPVIHGRWSDLKRCDISFQRDQGMNLKAEISLFFRRAFPIIGSICTGGAAVTRPSKLTDRKWETINDKIAAVWDRKHLTDVLTEQFCDLQKGSSGSVKPGTATQIGEKVPIIAFYKGIPGIFGGYAKEFATNTQGNHLWVR